MADWAAFAGFAGVVLLAVLVLSKLSQGALSPAETTPRPDESADERQMDREGTLEVPRQGDGILSPTALLVNVAITQGLFLGVLLVGIWWAAAPPVALGLGAPGTLVPVVDRVSAGIGPRALALGAATGVAVYALNEFGTAAVERFGIESDERLRETLAPEDARGWGVLLALVLPVIAGFEELLFRGVLIGGLSIAVVETGLAGPGIAPWLLVAGSSAVFALGHGAQGRGGMLITGTLGAALGGLFVVTWSLLAVFVAHYLVNALEFLVHEWLGIEWP